MEVEIHQDDIRAYFTAKKMLDEWDKHRQSEIKEKTTMCQGANTDLEREIADERK